MKNKLSTKFESFLNESTNSKNILDKVYQSIENRFNQKVNLLTKSQETKTKLVSELSEYILSLGIYELSNRQLGTKLIFHPIDNYKYNFTIENINKIVEICNSIDEFCYNFVEFRTKDNNKISIDEIIDNNKILKMHKLIILIDYNI